jgi:trehalose-6-phosphate synthase
MKAMREQVQEKDLKWWIQENLQELREAGKITVT